MSEEQPLYQALYVSRLASTSAYGVVNEIVAGSRRDNPKRGITGALLFDGEFFGQLLEGSEAEVTTLLARIQLDTRHTDVTVLFSGASGAPRCTRAWRSGYCEPQQLEVFVGDDSLRGVLALATFMSILLGADVE